MAEMVTLELGMAVLAMIVLDLVLNPEPMLGLRRAGGLGGLLLGGLITLVARAGIGAALFWLAQRNATLFSLGEVQVSLTGIVFLAAGGLLLFRVLTEIIQLSAPRPVPVLTDSGAEAMSSGVIAAAVLASVEPAAMGLGLAMSLEAIVAGLVLGGVLVPLLARPMARLVNHFPHMRLLGLMALAVIGSGLVLTALGGAYPRPGMQGGVLVLALIAVGALIVLRQTGAQPAFVVIPVEGDDDIAPQADAARPYVEPAFAPEPASHPLEEAAESIASEPLPDASEPEPAPAAFTMVEVEPEPRTLLEPTIPAVLEVEPDFGPMPEPAPQIEPVQDDASQREPVFEPETAPEVEAEPASEPLPQPLALEPGDRPVPQSAAERARPPRRPLRRRRPSWRDSRRA